MNKTDQILERLKNQPKPAAGNPDELTDLIMGSLPEREDAPRKSHTHQLRLYVASAIAVAASLLLLLVLQLDKDTTEQQHPLAALQQPKPERPAPKQEEAVEVKQVAEAQPVVAQAAKPKKRARKPRRTTEATPTAPQESTPTTAMAEQHPTIVMPNPAEEAMREFWEQTASIRRRGEQVMLRVAALSEQQSNNPQYIEL